jgi:hypothetical protein
MSDTTTAREISVAANLSKRGIEKRAAKENWPFEEIAQRGGLQRHYPLATLPAELQAAVRSHRAIATINTRTAEDHKRQRAQEAKYREKPLGERLVIAMERIATALEHAHSPIISQAEPKVVVMHAKKKRR